MGSLGVMGAGVFGANMPSRVGRALTDVERLRLELLQQAYAKQQKHLANIPGTGRIWQLGLQSLEDMADEIQHVYGAGIESTRR